MILEILPYSWQISYHWQTQTLQLIGRTHPGEQQEVRRVHSTTTEKDFLARGGTLSFPLAHVLHANRTNPFKEDARCQNVGLYREVCPRERRVQESYGSTAPLSLFLSDLNQANSFLFGAVEIRVGGVALRKRRFEKSKRKFVGGALIRHMQGASTPVIVGGSLLL